jgi:hypothetical protein
MAKSSFHCAECGASVQVIGRNRSDADRLAKYREQSGALCHDCWKKQREAERAAESQQAAEEAAQAGLPVLQGTEKQVAWAETIRAQALKQIEDGVAGKSDHYYWDDNHIFDLLTEAQQEDIRTQARSLPVEDRAAFRAKIRSDLLNCDRMRRALAAIRANDSAHWWIENRDWKASKLLADQYRKTAPAPEPMSPAEIIADAKAEATVRPESPKTETVAEIAIDGSALNVVFPEKREDFRQLIRFELGFTWADTHWRRTLGKINGNPADRAAEVGHRLLAAGFIIRIYDPAIRASAVAGDYQPERTRWVMARTAGQYAGWFSISWGKDEDFYAAAKKLPRSQYSKPTVVVPAEFFEEILDFAQSYDFELSDGAQKLVAQARANKEAAMIAKVKPAPKREKTVADTTPPKLDVPDHPEIDDDLRDGD